MPVLISLIVFAAILVLVLVILSLVVIQEYERGVVFRLGKYVHVKNPGLRMRIPFGIDVVKKVDIRVRTIDVPEQEVITKDNVSIRVDAVVYYRSVNPVLVITKVVS